MLTLKVSRWPFFIMGMVCYAGMSMFYQDWLGLDGYVAAVQNGWVDTTCWTDAVIVLAAVGGMIVPFRTLAQKLNPCVACTILHHLHQRPEVGPALDACTAEQHSEMHNEVQAIVWAAAELGILRS